MIITSASFAKTIPIQIYSSKIWVTAISGGADSLCLTLLANDFAKKNDIKLIACFVDHKLRPESTLEIMPIINILENYKINYQVLTWHHQENLSGNIQNKARIARYQLLCDFCKNINCNVMLTGHHALDQWETFFMRLSRGSALKGLSCIANIASRKNITIFRPLLSFSPEDIKQTLNHTYSITNFINDPSNKNEKYERIRWRVLYGKLPSYLNLRVLSINKTIQRLQNANSCINAMAQQLIPNLFLDNKINLEKFAPLPKELQIRILQMIISKITEKEHISYALLEKTAEKICNARFIATNICNLIFRKISCQISRKNNIYILISIENRISVENKIKKC